MIFCSGNASQHHHLTFQILTKSHEAFLRYEPSKIGLVSFFSLSRCESCCKTQKHYPITLKFGTLKGRIRVHPDTKFDCNTINGHKALNNYLQKNNTLSRLQGKPLMARSWKSARRQGNYWTLNLSLFERNWAKDHENTAKNPTVGNNYMIKIYWQDKLIKPICCQTHRINC